MGFINLDYSKQFLKGKTPEQKKILQKYFLASGCIGSLTAMKDEQYDALVKEKVDALNLKQRALNKIGLDESEVSEIAPVTFYGWERSGDWCGKRGKDGEYRTSKYQTSWIFFSSTQVYAYSSTVDMIGNSKSEYTEEYFYKDITNFAMETSTEEFKDMNNKPYSVEFNAFKIVVPGDKKVFAVGGMNMEEVERSLQAMKQKLREKKM